MLRWMWVGYVVDCLLHDNTKQSRGVVGYRVMCKATEIDVEAIVLALCIERNTVTYLAPRLYLVDVSQQSR